MFRCKGWRCRRLDYWQKALPPEGMNKDQAGLSAGKRYMLDHYPKLNPTLGLNTQIPGKVRR
jgi:hypothetical protein